MSTNDNNADNAPTAHTSNRVPNVNNDMGVSTSNHVVKTNSVAPVTNENTVPNDIIVDDYTNKDIAKSLFSMSGKFFMYLFVAIFSIFFISISIGLYKGFFGGMSSYIDPNIFQIIPSLIF